VIWALDVAPLWSDAIGARLEERSARPEHGPTTRDPGRSAA
jgi:hypothetical protein